jgi:hypothetical protein
MPNPARVYVCPRCTYQTTIRLRMNKHFYQLKKSCPAENDLELTEEIKKYVLENYKYAPMTQRPRSTTQIINNFNTLNNFIVQMNFSDKIDHLMEYQQKRLIGFEDSLEKRFQYRVNRLDDDKFPVGYFLSQNDLIGLVDDVTRISRDNMDRFNVFYNKTIKRFRLYQGKDWESFIEEIGAKELVNLIKSYFLDSYELYLIRHLHQEELITLDRFKLLEHLEIYYRFIAAFDLLPYICDQDDREVLGHRLVEDQANTLAERYMKSYFEQKNALKRSDKGQLQKKIVNIVKENTSHNVAELNQALIDILKIDQDFREQIINSGKISPQ